MASTKLSTTKVKEKQSKTVEQPDEQERPRPVGANMSQDAALFRLIGIAMAPYWHWMALAFVLMLATAASNVIPPYLLQQAIDGPLAHGDIKALWRITFLYGATAIVAFILTFAYTYYLQKAAQNALTDLRTRLFDHILTQDHGFLTGTSTGELVARLTSDIESVNAMLSSSVVVILVEGVTLVVIVIVMFATNWRLAIIALAVLPLVSVVTRYFRERIRKSSSGERSALARISAFISENLHGMTIVQLFGHEAESEEEFEVYNSGYREALIILRRHSAVFLSVQEILAAFGLGLILYGGGRGVMAGWATLGMLVAFTQYTDRAFQPVLNLSQEYNTIQIALGAAERIYRMLQRTPMVQSPANPQPLAKVRGDIEFRDVHFFYNPDEPVLRGVALHIPAGQSLAIVGATGAGKSSLVSLLARYYDPRQGQVLLDGVDIRQLSLDDLRQAVTVVPQDAVTLAGSIRHNIVLYRTDISEERIRQAAEFSNAARFIEQLPGGYDFQVLPGGANLSQGQRQLLALARALALSPDAVLVLDEATSSIDTETEALIQEALERILSTRTSLVIAHRLSTVRGADRIIVMDRGKIVEDGNHASLLALGGYYARLCQHQTLPAGQPL
ncbi:MAG: ABC transporter ATP-binding protein [Caldilineaceae bacterium]